MKGVGPGHAPISSFVILFGTGCSSLPPPGEAKYGIGVTETVSQQAKGRYSVADRVVYANQAFVSPEDDFLIHVTAKTEDGSEVRPVSVTENLAAMLACHVKYYTKTKLDVSMVHDGWLDPRSTFGSAGLAVPIERDSDPETMIASEYHREMTSPYAIGMGEGGTLTILSRSPLEFPDFEYDEPRHHLVLSLPDQQGRQRSGYVLLVPFAICVDTVALLVLFMAAGF